MKKTNLLTFPIIFGLLSVSVHAQEGPPSCNYSWSIPCVLPGNNTINCPPGSDPNAGCHSTQGKDVHFCYADYFGVGKCENEPQVWCDQFVTCYDCSGVVILQYMQGGNVTPAHCKIF